MNPYERKGLRRILLHSLAFGGVTDILSFAWWDLGGQHYLLIPGLAGIIVAFGKELWENIPKDSGLPGAVGQVWIEFWIDSLVQSFGVGLGVFAVWYQSH